MIVVVDERQTVADAFVKWLEREGVAATGIGAHEVGSWISAVCEADVAAVEAFLIGECHERVALCRVIRNRSRAVIMAMSETRSLETTLELFAAGVDDVVRKPIHVREILARINAVSRRSKPAGDPADLADLGDIRIFFDGRDPLIAGETMLLPRRERRILEYLAGNIGCRVTKSQIFNAVYGLFNEDIDENVIESHISKLRKRLRSRLGYDPIDSKRFLGYRLALPGMREVHLSDGPCSSPAQDSSALIDNELMLMGG